MYFQEAIERETMKNALEMSLRRELERPSWSRNGTLYKKPTRKHYIPKHKYYYSPKELFEGRATEQQRSKSREVEDYLNTYPTQGEARRAFSAPHQATSKLEETKPSTDRIRATPPFAEDRKSSLSRELRRKSSASETSEASSPTSLTRPKRTPPTLKSGTYQKTFPESVPWNITTVPGVRVLQEHDHYRRKALDMKNTDIFMVSSGLIPKYMGYVPGIKFRHGGTYGTMTYNAKEVGVEISPTWGGAVSLLL